MPDAIRGKYMHMYMHMHMCMYLCCCIDRILVQTRHTDAIYARAACVPSLQALPPLSAASLSARPSH